MGGVFEEKEEVEEKVEGVCEMVLGVWERRGEGVGGMKKGEGKLCVMCDEGRRVK